MPYTHLPVSVLSGARKQVARSTEMSAQLYVFVRSPKGQIAIQLAHRRIERRAIIPRLVLEPASYDRIEDSRQIFDRLVAALCQFPATNFCSNDLWTTQSAVLQTFGDYLPYRQSFPFRSAMHCRRWWFGTGSCKPVPRGLPSSVKQLRTTLRFLLSCSCAHSC
jgi:hypothetical protein